MRQFIINYARRIQEEKREKHTLNEWTDLAVVRVSRLPRKIMLGLYVRTYDVWVYVVRGYVLREGKPIECIRRITIPKNVITTYKTRNWLNRLLFQVVLNCVDICCLLAAYGIFRVIIPWIIWFPIFFCFLHIWKGGLAKDLALWAVLLKWSDLSC